MAIEEPAGLGYVGSWTLDTASPSDPTYRMWAAFNAAQDALES